MPNYRKDEAGVVWREAYNPDGTPAGWFETDKTELPPEPYQLGKNASPRALNARNRAKRQRELLEQAMKERGPAAQQLAEEVENMGFLERLYLGGGMEATDLYQGVQEAGDWLDENFLAGAPGADKERLKEGAQSRRETRARLAPSQEMYEAVIQENLGAGMLGGMLPYVATNPLTAPIKAGVEKTGQSLTRGLTAAEQAGGGLAYKGLEQVAKHRGPWGRGAKRFKTETVDPRIRAAEGRAKRFKEVDPYRTGVPSQITADAILGTAEGALHPEMKAWEGLVASAAGSSLGAYGRHYLAEAPNFRNTAEKELLDWGEHEGFRYLPGMKRGSRQHQMFEAGIRNDTDWTDAIAAFDRTNEAVYNRIAYESMGVDPALGTLSPEKLRSHMGNLRKQYQKLETNTIGKFDYDGLVSLTNYGQSLRNSPVPDLQKAGKTVEGMLKRFRDLYQPNAIVQPTRQTARGARPARSRVATYDGAQYQQVARELQDTMDGAFKKGDFATYNALKPLKKELNNSIERGIQEAGGDTGVKSWKQLNEQWALSKDIMEHGMTPTAGIDLKRYRNHLMSNDAERFITENTTSAPVQNLWKASKVRDLELNQMGSPLTGHNMKGIKNPKKMNAWQRLLSTNNAGFVPALPKIYMGAYKRGFPVNTGLMNMNRTMGEHLWEPMGLGRAGAQNAQIQPAVVNAAMDTYDWMGEVGGNISDNFLSFTDWLAGRTE